MTTDSNIFKCHCSFWEETKFCGSTKGNNSVYKGFLMELLLLCTGKEVWISNASSSSH